MQRHFGVLFNLQDDFAADGSEFDHLFSDLEEFRLGEIKACVLHTPGHTSACACYVFGDAAFVGDTLLMPDTGTGRSDFPGGSAAVLYQSLTRILALDPAIRVFVGHDDGRAASAQSPGKARSQSSAGTTSTAGTASRAINTSPCAGNGTQICPHPA